jgi:hypothetical protein
VATGATLTAPGIGSFSRIISPRAFKETGSLPFAVEAYAGVTVLRILGAGASIATILGWLGIHPARADRPDYRNAGGCTQNYQAQEGEMRQRGINSFSAVHRTPENHDLAIMAGAYAQSQYFNEAAMQYDDRSAINLRGREIEAVGAAARYLYQSRRLCGCDLARAIAVTGKYDEQLRNPRTGGQVTARRFETALGGYIFDNPRHPAFSGGAVAVHAPGLTDYDNSAVIGLTYG